MNKYNFISDLLRNKTITPSQKERIVKLASKELEQADLGQAEIVKRIEEIEKTLIGNKNTTNGKETIKKHNPKETYELLSYFSSMDGGMKNLTHSFNYGYITYDDLMKTCKEEFETGKKKYPNVPTPLLKRIEQFSFSENPNWYIMRGEQKIEKKLGWSEPAFVKWYKENKTHPANDSYYNSEMIMPFKQTIQIRSDLGNLINLMRELSEIVFQNDIKMIVKDSVSTAQFYTDVDRLGLAVFHIFHAIKSISDQNFCDEVEINFKIQDTLKVLEIIHLESTPTKSVNDFDFLGGDLSSARSNLWGLCNYYIAAKFNEGKYQKVILSDKYEEMEKNKDTGKWIGKNLPMANQDIKGFTHILKFY